MSAADSMRTAMSPSSSAPAILICCASTTRTTRRPSAIRGRWLWEHPCWIGYDWVRSDGRGAVLTGTCSSDERLKRNVRPVGNVLDRVIHLQPMHYQWRGSEFPLRGIGDGEDIGLIAQDVEKVMPELVVQDTDGFRAVHYERLPMLLLQSVRELKSENDALKRLLTEQEARLRALEASSVRQPQ